MENWYGWMALGCFGIGGVCERAEWAERWVATYGGNLLGFWNDGWWRCLLG